MNKITLLIVFLIPIVSCNNHTKNNISQDIVTMPKDTQDSIAFIKDSVVSIETVPSDTLMPRTIEINNDTYFTLVVSCKDTISDSDKYKLREFTRLKDGQNQFKYYLIENLQISNSFKSLLIAEDYESEQACWLVNYDKNNNLISSYQIFYDNAEGAWNTSTDIDLNNGILKIRKYDAYATPEEKTMFVRINPKGQFTEQ